MQNRLFSHVKRMLVLASTSLALSSTAQAADFVFSINPLTGSAALLTPGRQVVGSGEQFIGDFNLMTDRLVFDTRAFGTPADLSFVNTLGRDLPDAGADFISLRDIDADGNVANGVLNNAGLSASLIAANAPDAGAGFFFYFNSGLNLNRLVFSTDLGDPTADLAILARFTNQTGTSGAAALQQFSAGNIAAAVPEPATWAMMVAGFGMVGGVMRRRAGGVAVATA